MTDKKKTYQQPTVKVAMLKQTDILCTSTGDNKGSVRIGDDEEGIYIEEVEW